MPGTLVTHTSIIAAWLIIGYTDDQAEYAMAHP